MSVDWAALSEGERRLCTGRGSVRTARLDVPFRTGEFTTQAGRLDHHMQVWHDDGSSAPGWRRVAYVEALSRRYVRVRLARVGWVKMRSDARVAVRA